MSAGSAQDSTPFILRVFEAAEQVLWSSSVSLAFSDNKAVSSSFQAERVRCLGKASRIGSDSLHHRRAGRLRRVEVFDQGRAV